MVRLSVAIFASLLSLVAVAADAPAEPARAWIATSNAYTNRLLAIQLEHHPERGTREGVTKYDERVSNPTLADEMSERRELEAQLARIDTEGAKETDKRVQQDLQILRKAFNLQFRQQDYRLQHEVPFINASERVFQGLRGLLDEQVSAERRAAALVRLRRYAGTEQGYQPLTEILKARELEQIGKPDVIYPSKQQIETEFGRNSNYVEEIATLFRKYQLTGWEPAYARLKEELGGYDAWVREAILPKARSDFRLPPEKYALAFEEYGIDIPPAQVASLAHAAFAQYQAEMAPLAAQIAKSRGYSSVDYRAVVAELKKQQITGEAILPFYEKRLHEIERI